jgi:hypothetical protein
MTMQHIRRSFEVSLSISHPDIEPAEISRIVGLVPKRATRVGELRTTPRGERLEGAYEFSHWTHSFDVQRASELGVVLEDLVERLQSQETFFHRVVRDAWGQLLADLTRHIANGMMKEYGWDYDATRDRIKTAFLSGFDDKVGNITGDFPE